MSTHDAPTALSNPADIDNLAMHARSMGDTPAVWLDGDDTPMTFASLDKEATRVAHWLHSLGLQTEDGIAFLLDNRLDYYPLSWGARRAGLYYTPISIHLQAPEIAYVLRDSGAKLLITCPAMADLAQAITQGGWAGDIYILGGEAEGLIPLQPILDEFDPAQALPQRPVGRDFLYSSGTSGKPKGIKRPLIPYPQRLEPTFETGMFTTYYKIGKGCRYLSPAPLYHAAPHRFTMRSIEFGGTVVVMPKFNAERALQLVEKHRCTHSQWVPTMMVRMLALPNDVKAKYDLSSMTTFIHAAAPCPPAVKQGIIDWWGPIVVEYYGGSEAVGITVLDSQEWLAHPGSVGKAIVGVIHIKDENGHDLPVGEQGHIYFSGTPPFLYHNDPEKTAKAYAEDGAATYGDLGHVDEEGYLYLSGRRTDLIISGGVNIYPQEAENLLSTYPGIADVAVIGVPHPEFGQEVKAVIELLPGVSASGELAEAILAHCREHLGHIKCPRSVDFTPRLPREANGKLYKRHLIAEYEARAQAPQ